MWTYRAILKRVIDGDTIVVDIDLGLRNWQHDEHIRLAGIDTPEIRGDERPEGLKSKAFVEQWLGPPGSWLWLRTEKSGKFGRWLAWIWKDAAPALTSEITSSLNQVLVDEGLADPYLS